MNEKPEVADSAECWMAPRKGRILELEVLYRDSDVIAIFKPAGLHVHQPESSHRVPREMTVLWTLRRQTGLYLYPIHRIDAGTEGVLLMALSSESAAAHQREFQAGRVKKVYHAVCRGWTTDGGRIETPLESDSTGELAAAETDFSRIGKTERAAAVGKRHSTARYSLVEARPHTGRWHQLRRHLARSNHPIVGDREHGDSHHNRYFRAELGLPGLWLRAESIELMGRKYVSPQSTRWQTMLDVLEFRS